MNWPDPTDTFEWRDFVGALWNSDRFLMWLGIVVGFVLMSLGWWVLS